MKMNPKNQSFDTKQVSNINIMLHLSIKTEKILPYLPKRMKSFEVGKSTSMFVLGICRFVDNNFATTESCYELFFGVLVYQDATFNFEDETSPGLYVINLTSDSENFLEFMYDHYKMPVFKSSELKVKLQYPTNVEIKDGYGPIVTIRNIGLEPVFQMQNKELYCYASPDKNGNVYYAKARIQGNFCMHQEKGNWGELYEHPFFLGLDVKSLKENDLKMQSFLKQEELATTLVDQSEKLL